MRWMLIAISLVALSSTGFAAERPLNFATRIEPILTKFSCNSGGCHGKIQGQNGFRLSLLGFDPELDYSTIVREARGRRVFSAAPDQSLLLLKASGQVPHGGGRKIPTDSADYQLLRRWIAEGMPYGSASDPVVTKVVVSPDSKTLGQKASQQLAVTAHYSDGVTEDVTRLAQYESNETDVATVTEGGLVQTLSSTGQAGVMVRYAGKVTAFRAVVPRPGPAVVLDFQPLTVVDQYTTKKWKELNIAPSAIASDEAFCRRAFLDITGTLPTAVELKAFAADKNADKRAKLIDTLLDSPHYAEYFANKWSDLLKVTRKNQPNRASGTFAFHDWIRDAVAADVPYDRFVREILTATGDETKSPATVWYREIATPEQFADDASQLFLGQRMACANCHHHPYEKWSQDDYWGLAAFYSRVGRKQVSILGSRENNQQNTKLILFTKSNGTVTNKRSNKPAVPKPLDAAPTPDSPDLRTDLANWMTDPANPFFAKALANRYWAHFFGRGIVDPVDDLRVTNPPSNPELLDALAADFVAKKFSIKELIRTIAKSRTYQLSSLPNESNATDKQSFARYYPKRLPAEVLFDAVCQVTGTPSVFPGLPEDQHAPARAIALPDESFRSYFLDVSGRPQRLSACECERVSDASLALTLHLLNSQEVQDKLAKPGGTADRLAKDARPDAEKVEDLFLIATAKRPTAEQMKAAKEHLAKHEKTKKQAYENLLWALINGKAFLFNQ